MVKHVRPDQTCIQVSVVHGISEDIAIPAIECSSAPGDGRRSGAAGTPSIVAGARFSN
jgi:hypothetical protein